MQNSDKLVVVTGGTKGIGRAIIEAFSALGYSIATCSRNEGELAALKTELKEKYQNKIHILKADLSRKEPTKEFIDFVRVIGKPVEVLVNNTGKFIPGEIHLENDGVLEEMISTNLYSAYRVSRGLIPLMKAEMRGHIFNICSIASITAYKNGGSYSISKFAMYGMSKVMREELKPYGIKVTSVLPGATFTESWEGVELPEDRFIDVNDIARLVLATFQLSPRAVVEDLLVRPQLGDI